MRRALRHIIVVFAGAAVFVACGGSSDTAPASPSLNGTWAGTSGALSMTMTLRDVGGAVFGSGHVINAGITDSIGVLGQEGSPDFALTITPAGYQPVTFQGTFTSSTMTGTLTGSGFTGAAFSLTKSP